MNSKGSTDEGPQKPSQDTSFLYSRESDRIGEGVVSLFDFAFLSSNSSGVLTRIIETMQPYSDSTLSRVFRQRESDSINKRRKNSMFAQQQPSSAETSSRFVTRENVKQMLANYNHNPLKEIPNYTTTSNQYGLSKMTEADVTQVRYGISQSFSKSFNNMMYIDEGLVTSHTKSNIHNSLIP